MPRSLRILIAVAACSSFTIFATAAEGKGSVYLPAPSYPNSTLAIKVAGKPRAGKVVKVVISGSNAPFQIGGAGSGDFLAYQLDAFAQNGRGGANVPPAFAGA